MSNKQYSDVPLGKTKGYSVHQVAAILSKKGCKVTMTPSQKVLHEAKCKNYGEYEILQSLHKGKEVRIKSTHGKDEITAEYEIETKPVLIVDVEKAHRSKAIGNSTGGKLDFMQSNGFQIMNGNKPLYAPNVSQTRR